MLALGEALFRRAKPERFARLRPRSIGHLFPSSARVIAHRGGAGAAPENTLAAFRRAKELGVPIELDVTRCKSGEVVVFHDDTLDRTAGRAGRPEDLTLDELRRLDAGTWFGPAFAGERIPTLAEVIALVGRDVVLDVEIKSATPRRPLANAVVDVLAEARLLDRALVTSFDPLILGAVRRRAPELRRGQIYSTLPDGDLSLAQRFALRTLALNAIAEPDLLVVERSIIDAGYVRAMHDRGVPIFAWTVNDRAEMERLWALGTDAVITDWPERAV